MSGPVIPVRTLRLVPLTGGRSSISSKIAALQAQAQEAAREHVDHLVAALELVARLSEEIVGADGAVFPPGIVEACRQLAEQTPMARLHIQSIQQRIKP